MEGLSQLINIVIFLGLLSSVELRTGPMKSRTFVFNDELATGSLECPGGSDLLDIVSIEYKASHNIPCQFSCSNSTEYPSYLDGPSDPVCGNENNIRAVCYAQNNCILDSGAGLLVTRPPKRCSGNRKAKQLTVSFYCVKPDNVFDLCKERYTFVEEETPLIFTTPRVASTRGSCSCILTPRESKRYGMSVHRWRMAQFFIGDGLWYTINKGASTSDGVQYRDDVLLTDLKMNIGGHSVKKFEILLTNSDNRILTGSSRAYVVIKAGKNLAVSCNDATRPIGKGNTQRNGKGTTLPSYASTDKDIVAHTQSIVTDEGSGMKNTVIGLSIASGLLVVIVIIFVAVLCFRRHRKRRREKYGAALANNNNEELSAMTTFHRGATEDGMYHELESENLYDIIPGGDIYGSSDQLPGEVDDTPCEYTRSTQPQDSTLYKVTVLAEDPVPNHYYEKGRATANVYVDEDDKVRNSRGSIDVYTENSTITDPDIYSQPCDVIKTDVDKQGDGRQYDVPAEIYARVDKSQHDESTVHLLENSLYESSSP